MLQILFLLMKTFNKTETPNFVTRHTIVVGYYGITLAVLVSVRLSYISPSVFSFLDDNLSKCQWIFTRLGMWIDSVAVWFEIVNGKILSILNRVICPRQIHILISG